MIVLSGEGYSLMWPEGDAPRRYEWRTTPARYLAFKHEVMSIRNAQGRLTKAWDQPPHLRRPD